MVAEEPTKSTKLGMKPTVSMNESRRSADGSAVELGLKVSAALAVLTAIEYLIPKVIDRAILPLFIVAAVKGWLVLDYFMHFRRNLGLMNREDTPAAEDVAVRSG